MNNLTLDETLFLLGLTTEFGWLIVLLLVFVLVDLVMKVTLILCQSKFDWKNLLEKTLVSSTLTGKFFVKLARYFGILILAVGFNTLLWLTKVNFEFEIGIIPIFAIAIEILAEMISILGTIRDLYTDEDITIIKQAINIAENLFGIKISKQIEGIVKEPAKDEANEQEKGENKNE